MNNKTIKKSIALLMLILIIFSNLSNIVFANDVSGEKLIKNKGDCGLHLQYWKESIQNWSYIKCYYVVYQENGKEYPAYCLEQDRHRSW